MIFAPGIVTAKVAKRGGHFGIQGNNYIVKDGRTCILRNGTVEDRYASRALSLEPGIQDAYYWISIAAEATGNSMMKERYDQMARDELPEEEYQKVQHLLEIRTHKEE